MPGLSEEQLSYCNTGASMLVGCWAPPDRKRTMCIIQLINSQLNQTLMACQCWISDCLPLKEDGVSISIDQRIRSISHLQFFFNVG